MENECVITKTVLIVDDEAAIRDICQRVLSNEGFEVDIADNGKTAQEMIQKQQYGLLLFDIRMPSVNGIELYEWLQEKYPQLKKRVIFTTGDIMSGDIQRFLEQSGRPFLPKPFTPKELECVLRESLKEIE